MELKNDVEKKVYLETEQFLQRPQVSDSDIQQFIQTVEFKNLFHLVPTMDSARVAVNRVFSSTYGATLVESPEILAYLCEGIEHEKDVLRKYSLQQVKNSLRHAPRIDFLLEPRFFELLAKRIGDDSVSVFDALSSLFQEATKFPQFLDFFFAQDTIQKIFHLSNGNSTVEVRCFSLYVSVGCACDEAFQKLKSVDVIPRLLKALERNDLLFQMALLQTLAEFGRNSRSLKILSEAGVLDQLALFVVDESASNSLASGTLELIDGLIVSSKANQQLEWLANPVLSEVLTTGLKSADETVKAMSVSCVSNLATCPGGLQATMDTQLLPLVLSFMFSVNEKIELAALQSVWLIFSQRYNPNSDEFTAQHTLLKLISQAAGTPEPSELSGMNLILEKCRNKGKPNVRNCGLCMLSEISLLPWGPQRIMAAPGLIEWLLNYQDILSNVDRDLKEKVVMQVIENPATNPKTAQDLRVKAGIPKSAVHGQGGGRNYHEVATKSN